MFRSRGKVLTSSVALFTLLALLSSVDPPAAAGDSDAGSSPELSVTDRLDDRRYVAIGPRAYDVGTEAGRYPAMGFHTRGEMGGIWSPPIKLLDGIWFGIDGSWIGPATEFTSGYGYVRMDLPETGGMEVSRTDFASDDARAVLVGLRFDNPGAAQTFELQVDAHSELMGIYPWGETNPSQLDFNLTDTVSFDGSRLTFREQGQPHPNAETHDWAAVVGSSLEPTVGETGEDFRGPQDPPVICPASGPDSPPQPPRCDDTEYGKGMGGRLTYSIEVPAEGARTVWFAVAGSDMGPSAAEAEFATAIADPQDALDSKIAARLALAENTRVNLPGDPLLEQGIEWSKQNLADSVQVAEDLEIRETNAGANYPPPEGSIDRVRFLGAGFPDYPWLFGTDGEYTAFASVAAGQFEPIKDHLRALKQASLIDNGNSGKVVHEVMTDGSVFFGSLADPGNTDETAKLPSAVALIWRWTGDDAFRDEMYSFSVSNMRYIVEQLDEDDDGWPEGLGNVERPGMGEEKLDNTLYTIRGLFDLADMAKSKGDGRTFGWAISHGNRLLGKFENAWWMPEIPQHADSLDTPDDGVNDNTKIQQRHWIGVTPMEAELINAGGQIRTGVTTLEHGNQALDLRETNCYSDEFGLYHTGAPGCDPAESDRPAEKTIFTLNTAIMAVGEGNFGRLGPDQQQHYTTANRRLQLPDPDEQPGAMPEIAPSPDYGRSIDRLFTERAMVLQAWGNYGTLWPVVHQHLGVRPDMGRGELEVTPQVPPYETTIAGEHILIGSGSIDVEASHEGNQYRTTVTPAVSVDLTLGHTVPLGATVTSVTLNGSPVDYEVRNTNRGQEVLVDAPGSGTQTLLVTTS
jgi:hypothetical protein